MTPILYSQNNLPIYLKEDIISFLTTLYPNDQDKIIMEYEDKWVKNKSIVILLTSDLNNTNLDDVDNDIMENDEIQSINTMIKYLDDLEKKFLGNE